MRHPISRSKVVRLAALLAMTLIGVTARAQEQDPAPEQAAPPSLAWQPGPLEAPIGDALARIDLPEGYIFLDQQDTAKLLELMQNPVSGSELATIAPAAEDQSWMIFFEWDPVGWVDDAEKDELDADALLESIQEGTQQANEERESRGWPTIEIVGWHEAPHYDERTQNLTWAITGKSEGRPLLNRMVKLLGRRGVMTVTIVSDPEEIAAASAATDQLLGGYRFEAGSSYAEYVPGTDKIASYGLTALVAGGLGAAAVKSGLLGKFWKFLVVIAVGAVAGVRRLVMGRKHIADPPTPV